MPTERENNDIRKSMAYDLIAIIEEAPEQKSYSPEEVKKLIKTYIAAVTSN